MKEANSFLYLWQDELLLPCPTPYSLLDPHQVQVSGLCLIAGRGDHQFRCTGACCSVVILPLCIWCLRVVWFGLNHVVGAVAGFAGYSPLPNNQKSCSVRFTETIVCLLGITLTPCCACLLATVVWDWSCNAGLLPGRLEHLRLRHTQFSLPLI